MVGLLGDCDIDENDIVISGMSGRFPMSRNITEFEENLFSGKHLVTPKEDHIWVNNVFGVPNYVGQICDKTKFDFSFFGLPLKLAEAHDPVVRIALEAAFEAVHDAGLDIEEIRGRNGAVIMTSHFVDTEHLFVTTSVNSGMLGHSRTMLANRISYWMNLNGPSYFFFSTDAGGVEALTKGYMAIKSGECELAIVGSGNTILMPHLSQHYSLLKHLSGDGQCRSFDAQGSGYARSECVTVFLLQKAKHAKRIYASIVDSDIAMFGYRNSPLTRPRNIQYGDLLQEIYDRCGVDPSIVSYLEAEGNALKHIEEEEMKAVEKVFLKDRRSPLLIGSVKSNMGHGDAGANHCSVVKLLIALQKGFIPPNINFNEPAPYISKHVAEGKLQVVTEKTRLDGEYVGISTIELTGKAGHTLLRKFGKEKPKDTHKDKLPRLVLLTSRAEEGINKWLDDVEAMPVDTEYIGLVHEAFNSNNPNNFLKGYTIVPQTEKKLRNVQYFNGTKRPIWVVFSGMGSQWPGMGEDLMKLPVCASAIENCHAVLAEKGLDLKHIITTKDPAIFDNILHCFVGIAAIQIALYDVLKAVGIKPDGIVGHSVGELGCAYSDGCFTQEQMILSAYYRGLASIQAQLIPGSMAAVGLGYKEVVGMLPETIDVACHNSASSATLSGPAKDVNEFVEELKAKKIFARAVNVGNIAYHSRYIRPAAPALLQFLKKVVPEPKKRSSLWICSSVPEEQWSTPLAEYASAEYFTNNLLSPVLFEEASRFIPKDAIVIEVAPHGLLQAILRRSLGSDCVNIALTQRGTEDNLRFMLAALGNIYLAGSPLKVQALYPPVQFPVSRGTRSIAPNITWEHSVALNEIYFSMRKNVTPEVTLSVDNESERVYIHHVINGNVILPTFALLKILWENLPGLYNYSSDKLPVAFENIRFFQQLELPERRSVKVESLIQKGSGYFEMSSNGVILVCGKVFVLEGGSEETAAQVPAIDGKSVLSAEDIYTEFDRRGHQYGKPFQGIKQATVCNEGSIAQVKWSDNWVTFVDSLFQLIMLQTEQQSGNAQQPFTIHKLTIEPHLLENSVEDVEVVYHAPTTTLSCTGVKIHNMKTVTLPKIPYEFTLSKIQFLPHSKSTGVREFTQMGIQIVQENSCSSSKVTVAVLTTEEAEDETTSVIKEVFYNDPNVTSLDVPLASTKIITTQDKATYGLIVSTNVSLQQESLRLLGHTNGFLMLRVPQNQALNLSHDVLVVAELCTNKERLVLLKKVYVPDKTKCSVLLLGGEVSSWLNQIKSVVPTERLYAVWQGTQEQLSVMLYSVKKLLHIPSLEHVRFIFIADRKAQRFSLDNEIYWKHIQQDLRVNIYVNGIWGSFYQVGVNVEKHASYELYLNSILSKNINYLALNLQDGDYGNAKSLLQKQGIAFGALDFSGHSATGQRVMGVARLDTKLNKIVSDEYLTWNLPKSWSLEDGATVPLAYTMAYYALSVTARIQQKQVVLIHSGSSTVGQACISLALHKNCTVFTTVSSEKQKKYLREKFPQLNSENICGIETTEFLVRVQRATKGAGAHIVVNTHGGSLLNASWKCLAWNGHFIQMGKDALVNNNSIGMYQFLNCAHFTGMLAENLLSISVDVKKELYSAVQEGIANGVVQPLKRCTFLKKQLDEALSTATDQDNINKVLIAVGEDHATEKKLFTSDPQSSYLVTGSKYQQCIDVAEWLIRRGALHVALAMSCKSVSNETLRRIEILQHYYGSKVHMLDAHEVSTVQRASKILKETELLTKRRLAGLFILPSECSGEENSSRNLDIASREVTSLKHFVCLLTENSWGICEKRRKEGFPALAVHWSNSDVKGFRLLSSLCALDRLLTGDVQDAVVIVKQRVEVKKTKEILTSMVTDLLPSSLEQVADFGEELATADSKSWLVELPSRSQGLAHTNNLPVVVMVPGTESPPQHFLKPLARKLINPTVCVKLPRSDISIEDAAARIAEEIEKLQSDFTYHLVGVSTGGILTLHIAQCLERKGADVSVILLDGAPETIQLKMKQLGEGSVAQNRLISILLNINDDKVYDELKQRSTLANKMKFALTQLPHDMQTRREHIEAAISSIYSIFDNVVRHKPSGSLLRGRVTLIRCDSSEVDDNCGLSQFFKQSVEVHMVKAVRNKMLSCDETAVIINENSY